MGKHEKLDNSFKYCDHILLCYSLFQFLTHAIITLIIFYNPFNFSNDLNIVYWGMNFGVFCGTDD